MSFKKFGSHDKAYLHRDGVIYELDLITLEMTDVSNSKTPPTPEEKVWFENSQTDRSNDVIKSVDTVEGCRLDGYNNRSVRSLIIIPAWSCSAKCSYCYTAAYKKDTSKLTPDLVEKAITDYSIDPEGIKGTIFIGGEPLDNIDAIEYCLDRFPNSDHTICTAFVADDEVLERLFSMVMFRSNVEISLSIDPPSSLRYKADKDEKNPVHSHDRNIEWFKKFYEIIPSRIRIKTTVNANAYEISKLRDLLPKGARIAFDGAGYGFGDIRFTSEKTIEGINNEFSVEADRILSGETTVRDSFLLHALMIHRYLSGSEPARTCRCGDGYFTLLPEGNLSYCDSPGKPVLDPTTLDHPQMFKETSVDGKCETCPYIKLCGGACAIKDNYELYCYVRLVDFAYCAYVDVFSENKERI